MGILHSAHQNAIDEPAQFGGIPFKSEDVKVFRHALRRFPIGADLPMALLVGRGEYVNRHVIAAVMRGGFPAELEDVDLA